MERMQDAQHQLARYLSGEIDRIEELEAAPLPIYKNKHHLYGRFVTPARDYWQLL